MNKSYTMIIPEKPSILAEERIFVYVPKVTPNSEGISKFRMDQFNIVNDQITIIPYHLIEPFLVISQTEPLESYVRMWYKWLYNYTRLGTPVVSYLDISVIEDVYMDQYRFVTANSAIIITTDIQVVMHTTLSVSTIDSFEMSVLVTPGVSKVAFNVKDTISITPDAIQTTLQLNRVVHSTDTIHITAPQELVTLQLNRAVPVNDLLTMNTTLGTIAIQLNYSVYATDSVVVGPVESINIVTLDCIVAVTDELLLNSDLYLPVEVQYFGSVDITEHMQFTTIAPTISYQFNFVVMPTDLLTIDTALLVLSQLSLSSTVEDTMLLETQLSEIDKFETTNYYIPTTATITINIDTTQLQQLFIDYVVFEASDQIDMTNLELLVTKHVDTIWSSTVTDDISLTTTTSVSQELSKYLVRFIDFYGNSIVAAEQYIFQYGNAIAPTPPTVIGYEFNFWDGDYTNILTATDIFAVYSRVSYEVTFNHPDTGVMAIVTVYHGENVPNHLVPTATKVGYTFSYWTHAYNNIVSNVTTTAYFEINKYTVRFYQRDGIGSDNWFLGNWVLSKTQLNVPWNTAATAPVGLDLTAYTFSSWNKSFSQIIEDIDVYATYTIREYYVAFYGRLGGTFLKGDYVSYGHNATAPIPPELVGCTFSGWDKAFTAITTPLTVTALYINNVYRIDFNSNGGSAVTYQQYSYQQSINYPLPTPTRTGYEFIEWRAYMESSQFNLTTMPAYDITLYAQWSILSYTVSFNSNGGSSVTAQQVVYGGTVSEPSTTKSGHTFAGWYLNVALTSGYNFTSTVQFDFTLYAKWTEDPIYYTVTFTNWNDAVLKTESVIQNGAATPPTNPTRTGYTFSYWDGTYFDVTSNRTIKAVFTADIYTVRYLDWDGAVLKTANVNYGSSVTPPADPVRSGYSFNGWNATSTFVTVSIDITALYLANTYTVSFDTGGYGAASPTSKTVTYGSTYGTLATASRTGYTLTGWFYGGTQITSGTTVTTVGSHTLVAQWAEVVVPRYWTTTTNTAADSSQTVGLEQTDWSSSASGCSVASLASYLPTASNYVVGYIRRINAIYYDELTQTFGPTCETWQYFIVTT